MSWWDTGEGDDVIGDRPADLLGAALEELASSQARATGERPTLPGLLAGLGLALSGPDRQVVVTAETGAGRVRGDGDQARAEGEALLSVLRGGLERVSRVYQERWERDARPSEVAATVAFVLRADPACYLRAADGEGLDLDALRAWTGEPE